VYNAQQKKNTAIRSLFSSILPHKSYTSPLGNHAQSLVVRWWTKYMFVLRI